LRAHRTYFGFTSGETPCSRHAGEESCVSKERADNWRTGKCSEQRLDGRLDQRAYQRVCEDAREAKADLQRRLPWIATGRRLAERERRREEHNPLGPTMRL